MTAMFMPLAPELEVAESKDVQAPSQSARVRLPSGDRAIWIASDADEATRLRQELADEGDATPVIIANDVIQLAGKPIELIHAAVRSLAAFPARRWWTSRRRRPSPQMSLVCRRRQ